MATNIDPKGLSSAGIIGIGGLMVNRGIDIVVQGDWLVGLIVMGSGLVLLVWREKIKPA